MAEENGVNIQQPANQQPPANQQSGVVIPEELKGKSGEEVYATVLAEYQQMEREKEAAIKERDALKKQPAPTQYQTPVQYQQPVQTVVSDPGAKQPDYWENPQRFVEKQLEERVAPLAAQLQNAVAQVSTQTFWSQASPEDLVYKEEVDKTLQSLDPSVRIDPRAPGAILAYIKGREAPKITQAVVDRVERETTEKVLKSLGLNPDEYAVPQPKPTLRGGVAPATARQYKISPKAPSNLTDEQKRVATNMGLTEKEYAEWNQEVTIKF